MFLLGVKENRKQFSYHLVQIFLVGLTVGMMRVVVPGMAESEFGVHNQALFLLASFVVVFGVVKAVMNLFAGALSQTWGRKTVMLWGWWVALPIPFILLFAPSWNWIIFATFLLGLNQGLCWSMALNSKLDLSKPNQKGFVNGVNEFFGYVAVGLAGVFTAYLVELMGVREALFGFSLLVIVTGLLFTQFMIIDTLPWSYLHTHVGLHKNIAPQTMKQLFMTASIKNKSLVALNQAGLVEKFVDALVWVFLPIYFLNQGLTLIEAGGIIAIYGVVWGSMQLVTGSVSDKVGRKGLIVWGMGLCGLGVVLIPLSNGIVVWSVEAAFVGLGMAMLYPNLGAAVGDIAPVAQRASFIGIYRFWRDSGYAFGALAMGVLAQYTQDLFMPFWFVGIAMILSALWVQWALPQSKPSV